MRNSVTAYPTIQVTQLTSTPFIFIDPTQVENPLSPLVSAKFYSPNGVLTLKLRATLYINSANTTPPFLAPPTENGNQLEVYFDYNFPEVVPQSYTVWYIEFDYVSATVGSITSIMSFLKDLDPETSRGTVTKVEQ